MAEEDNNRGTVNPAELWMDWYETSTKMWSEAMKSAPEGQADPWGLYRQWLEGIEEARKSIAGGSAQVPDAAKSMQAMMDNFGGAADPERMREFSEQIARAWQRRLKLGMDMMSAAPRWLEMMEQARKSLTEGVDADAIMDPLQLVTQWYNATSGPVSEYVKDILEQEEFLEPSSRFLQNYARLYKVFSRASEQYLSTLQFPTRSDITRVASLVVALEDKVDRIEEAFEDFEYGYAEPATAEEVKSVEERIDRLDRKLDASASTEDYATAGSVSALDRRMDQVEGKLDRLIEAVESLGSAPSDNAAANGGSNGSREIRATEAARRKAQELGVDLAEVDGTGTNGQITVEDVRKKGAS